MPDHGSVVPVDIPDTASGFKHRTELVYLPPRWFATNPAPKLPVVMMIGGEFNTPADWLRTGNAAAIVDDFAAGARRQCPGAGVRRLRRFVQQRHRVRQRRPRQRRRPPHQGRRAVRERAPSAPAPASADWGIVGWSMGGTCAVDLTVMHPELFSSFVDIAGDMGPNAGTKDQTVARLYGGNAAAWAQFDPTTVITKHGPYQGVSGWFAISTDAPTKYHMRARRRRGRARRARRRRACPAIRPQAANTLCALGQANGITCSVVPTTGRHDWPLATQVFTASLPWLAGRGPHAGRRQAVPALPAGAAGPGREVLSGEAQASSSRSSARVRARPSGEASKVAATYSSTPAARSSSSRSLHRRLVADDGGVLRPGVALAVEHGAVRRQLRRTSRTARRPACARRRRRR